MVDVPGVRPRPGGGSRRRAEGLAGRGLAGRERRAVARARDLRSALPAGTGPDVGGRWRPASRRWSTPAVAAGSRRASPDLARPACEPHPGARNLPFQRPDDPGRTGRLACRPKRFAPSSSAAGVPLDRPVRHQLRQRRHRLRPDPSACTDRAPEGADVRRQAGPNGAWREDRADRNRPTEVGSARPGAAPGLPITRSRPHQCRDERPFGRWNGGAALPRSTALPTVRCGHRRPRPPPRRDAQAPAERWP